MKTIIVTGGTAGIGYQTSLELARRGDRVVITGRDRTRGEAALETLRRDSGRSDLELALGDLSTVAGTRALVAELSARFPRIDVLINNAGAFPTALTRTSDGLELGFATNVVMPCLLTRGLLPCLEAARPARVVNLTGGSAGSALDVQNLQCERGFDGLNSYSHSKRGLEAMSLELASELAPHGVFVTIVYPGQASTAMTRSVTPASMPWLMRPFFPLFALLTREDGGKSARKASRSSVHAALAEELEGVGGRALDTHCRPLKLHRTVEDPANRRRVMDVIAAASDARAGGAA